MTTIFSGNETLKDIQPGSSLSSGCQAAGVCWDGRGIEFQGYSWVRESNMLIG